MSNHQELLIILTEVAAHWSTVGVCLGIPPHLCLVIKKDFHDCMNCLSQMLATWLRGSYDTSPEKLVHALKSAGMPVLARKMAVKFGECSQTMRNTVIILLLLCKLQLATEAVHICNIPMGG